MYLSQCQDISKPISRLLSNHKEASCSLSHHFIDGKYIRNMYIPAGTFAIGAIHKEDHLTILCRGSVQLKIGDESRKIDAPYVFMAKGGYRKILFAYSDSVISNVIETDLTNINKIEAKYSTLHEDINKLKIIKELQ